MAINYPQRYDDDFLNTIKTVIDHVNVHGKTIQDLVAEGQLTDEQYAHLIAIINGLLKSGGVGKYDLSLSLINEINNKRDKNIPVGLDDMAGDVLNALSDSQSNSFNLLSVPRWGSVSPKTTTFIFSSSNIYDYDNRHVERNVSINTGELITSVNWDTSDYIAVEPNANYTLKNFNNFAFYDATKNHVEVQHTPPADWREPYTITSPENGYYLRASHPNGHTKQSMQINQGDELLQYEEFYEYINQDFLPVELRVLSDAMTDENEHWEVV